ncbi:hypothetical protein HOC01_04350 [archaeon]|jgi:hypothetical protein|nr:hypothetical protein [archaeon]MBT6698357.1 hypothetical protein [archaeon]
MIKISNVISGKAMAVTIGVSLAIGTWFSAIGLLTKTIFSLFGAILIYYGTKND